MRTYPKIDTLFERDEDHKLTEKMRHPVIADIGRWIVTEKVDGTNIRVSKRLVLGGCNVEVNGRSDNAQIPGDLIQHLLTIFPPEKMDSLFVEGAQPGTVITLFGEGFGAGIQKG